MAIVMPAGQLITILIIVIRGRRMAVTVQVTTAAIHNHRQGHIRRHQDLLHQVEEFHLEVAAVVAVSADLAGTN